MTFRPGWVTGLSLCTSSSISELQAPLRTKHYGKHCPALFLLVNHPSKCHNPWCADQKARLTQPTPETSSHHQSILCGAESCHLLIFSAVLQPSDGAHAVSWLLSPTPLSIWQIHTPETQASSLGKALQMPNGNVYLSPSVRPADAILTSYFS